MWQANKKGILVLAVGLVLLGAAHALITPHDEVLADRIIALGFCLLLFGVGLASWVSVRTPEPEDDEEDETETNEDK